MNSVAVGGSIEGIKKPVDFKFFFYELSYLKIRREYLSCSILFKGIDFALVKPLS